MLIYINSQTLDGALLDEQGKVASTEQIGFYVYPALSQMSTNLAVQTLGERAKEAAEKLGCERKEAAGTGQNTTLLVSDMAGNEQAVENCMKNGGNVLWIPGDLERGTYQIGTMEIVLRKGKNVFFAAAKKHIKTFRRGKYYSFYCKI